MRGDAWTRKENESGLVKMECGVGGRKQGGDGCRS